MDDSHEGDISHVNLSVSIKPSQQKPEGKGPWRQIAVLFIILGVGSSYKKNRGDMSLRARPARSSGPACGPFPEILH